VQATDRFRHRIAEVTGAVESSASSIARKGFHSDLAEGAVRISIVDWSAVVIGLSGLLPGQARRRYGIDSDLVCSEQVGGLPDLPSVFLARHNSRIRLGEETEREGTGDPHHILTARKL